MTTFHVEVAPDGSRRLRLVDESHIVAAELRRLMVEIDDIVEQMCGPLGDPRSDAMRLAYGSARALLMNRADELDGGEPE